MKNNYSRQKATPLIIEERGETGRIKTKKIKTTIKIKTITLTILFIIAFVGTFTACDNGQGMMHGIGGSYNMSNWNWVQILLGAVFGFLIGALVFKKKQ